MKYRQKLKIKQVKIVSGSEINKNWKLPMQKIFTSKGVFFDNTINVKFEDYLAPFNWTNVIGKELEVVIIHGSFCRYIKHPSTDI